MHRTQTVVRSSSRTVPVRVRVRVRVRVFPNIVNFNFSTFSPSVYGLFILFFAYLPYSALKTLILTYF